MSKLLVIAVVLVAVSSCYLRDYDNENVKKGGREVVSYYGGNCIYMVGSGHDEEKGGDYRFLEVEIENSATITQMVDSNWSSLATSNIAYIMYQNLNAEERTHFDYVRTVLKLKDGKSLEDDFAVGLLDTVESQMVTVKKVADVFIKRNFQDLAQLNDERVVSREAMSSFIIQVQNNTLQGNFMEFKPIGFNTLTTDEGKKYLKVSGFFEREKATNYFHVVTDLGEPAGKFVQLGFALF